MVARMGPARHTARRARSCVDRTRKGRRHWEERRRRECRWLQRLTHDLSLGGPWLDGWALGRGRNGLLRVAASVAGASDQLIRAGLVPSVFQWELLATFPLLIGSRRGVLDI